MEHVFFVVALIVAYFVGYCKGAATYDPDWRRND